MPFDSNGTASLVPSYFVRDGDTILPSQHNPVLEDIRSMLSNVVVRDGRAPMTGVLNANGNKVTNLSPATDAADAAQFGQIESAAFKIGDFKDSARTLDSTWLKRNGAIYPIATYPDLAQLLNPIPSGVLWSARNSPAMFAGANGIARTDTGRIVVVGEHAGTLGYFGASSRSDDGVSWTSTVISASYSMYDVAFGNGRLVAVGAASSSSDGCAAVSTTNGASWSVQSVTPFLFRVTFANGYFYAVGNNPFSGATALLRSTDGASWSAVTFPAAVNSRYTIAYGGGIYTAVGYVSGYPSPSPSVTSRPVIRSTDGVNWTSTATSLASTNIRFANGKFLIPLSSGSIATSLDGLSFDPVSTGSSQMMFDVAYSAGYGWVGVGGTKFVSGNAAATEWQSYDLPSSSNFRCVLEYAPGSGRYIAAGDGGNILDGSRNTADQFRVPNDNPSYGWVKAL